MAEELSKEMQALDKHFKDLHTVNAWIIDGQLIAPVLAEAVIAEYGLYKNSEGLFDKTGSRYDDDLLRKILREKLEPQFTTRASTLIQFSALPALLDKIPWRAIDVSGDSVTQYIKDRMRQDIGNFVRSGNISTGFPELDKNSGGLFPGLYVIGAISSLGKTTLVHQIADNIAASGKHVIYFALEMSRLEMATKSIARKTAKLDISNAITSLQIRTGTTSRIVEQATQLYINEVEDRMRIIEGSFETTVKYIWEYTEQYIEQHKERPIIIVDYLQLLQSPQKTTAKESVDYNVVELKRLSRAFSIPVIAISSVNRSNYQMSVDFESFKESGSIEFCCDVAFGLDLTCIYEELFKKDKLLAEKRERIKAAKAEKPRKVTLACLKNRYGGTDWKINFIYYQQYDLLIEEKSWKEANPANNPFRR